MAHRKEILLLLLSVLVLKVLCNEAQNQTDQAVDELIKKDGKLEIVKRIKQVNPDGSYTIGYEADNGSFRIESRDVLGNIKGTYGFVDNKGEIERVSYSSTNASDIFSPKSELIQHSSVVQRNSQSTTQKPTSYYSSSTSPPVITTPLSVIQSIARRRPTPTTSQPKTTVKSNGVVYSSAAPRVLLQRPSLATTNKLSEVKSEVQINRPEASQKPHVFEDIKPVTEEFSEVRSNLLRRQTLPEVPFNTQEHVYGLQQSFGHNDVPDIYNSGATVTSRPLFTTSRPGLSTTAGPQAVPKPTARYVANYERNQLQEVESNTAIYTQPVQQEALSTAEPVSTSSSLPVSTPEPLVAIRHPFQQGAILVPLSQLQNRILPVENMQEVYNARRNYAGQTKRLGPPAVRPLPVQVDANGFIREMPQHVPTPYPLPVPVTPTEPPGNDIDQIQPPVSTRDFQTLLNHLIRRQKMLEKISELTYPRPAYQQQPIRFVQKAVAQRPLGEYQQVRGPARQYVGVRPEEERLYGYQYRQESGPSQRGPATFERQQYVPNRRAARLLAPRGYQQEVAEQSQAEEYLPADVRETLLLRMLQLAMNPALPLQEDEEEGQQVATVSTPHYQRAPVRNVEILGEDDAEAKKRRAKRYKEEDMEYME